jgi:hypothetical protein
MAFISLTVRSKNLANYATSLTEGFDTSLMADVIAKQSAYPVLNGTTQFTFLYNGMTQFITVDESVAQIVTMSQATSVASTTSTTFGIDTSNTTYFILKNSSGTCQVRNQTDTAFAPISASAGTFTLTATGLVTIDAATTDHTGVNCLYVDVDVNVNNVGNVMYGANVNADIETALGAAEAFAAYNCDIDDNSSDADGAGIVGYAALITSTTAGRADKVGFSASFDGTMSTADTVTGYFFYPSHTQSSASANTYGLRVNGTGYTHTNGNFYGVHVDTTNTISAGTSNNVNLIVGASSTAIEIDAKATNHLAGSLVSLSVDVNSASVNGYYADVDVSNALSAAEVVNGIKIDVTGIGGDDAASFINGVFVTSTGASGGTTTAFKGDGSFTYGIDMGDASVTTDIRLSEGALIDNTNSNILTFTEAGFNFVGNVTVNGTLNYALDDSIGGSDTYTATMAPALSAYLKGLFIVFYPLVNNVGACSLNINGLGAKNIKLSTGADPSNDDIIAAMPSLLSYDGTQFILCNPY